MNNCNNCNKETKNKKFCSRSCATSVNNKASPKRKKIVKQCISCDKPRVDSLRGRYCEDHLAEYKASLHLKDKTLGEYRSKESVKGKHPSWRNAHVRSFARSWNKELCKSDCMSCGYDKHIELAHIRGVTEFEDSELLSEVNSEKNLLALCPNCHWEFDNGFRDEIWDRLE